MVAQSERSARVRRLVNTDLNYKCMPSVSRRGARALLEEKASLAGGGHEQQCRVARAGYDAPLCECAGAGRDECLIGHRPTTKPRHTGGGFRRRSARLMPCSTT